METIKWRGKFYPFDPRYRQFLDENINLGPRSRFIRMNQAQSIFAHFKGRRMEDIDSNQINQFIVWMRNDKGFRWEHYCSTVRTLMRFLRWLEARGDRPKQHLEIQRMVRDQAHQPWFTYENYLTILEETMKPDLYWDEWTTLAIVGWNTGLRISDAMHVKWENVEWTTDILRVRTIKLAAKRQELEIPIEPELREHLKMLWDNRDRSWHSQNIMPMLVNLWEIDHTKVSMQWAKILIRCNLRKYGFHAFRRSFVIRMLNAGVDPKIIGSITGQSVDTVYRYAVHISHQAKVDALQKAREAMHQTRMNTLGIKLPTF